MSKLNSLIWNDIFKVGSQNPNNYVISDSNKSLTWKDLFCLTDYHLDNYRDRKSHFLVFYADRTVDSVAVMLGCLKNGLAFVPISRNQPLVRIHGALKQLSEYEVYDPSTSSFEKFNSSSSTPIILEESLMYLLFTSGSTGAPKGVQVTEKNLLNTLNWSTNYFKWKSNDVIGIVTPFNFDISIFDLFIGLTQNVKMHIFPTMLNADGIVDDIINNKISSIFSTPSFFSLLAKQVNVEFKFKSKLRRIISGGDFFPPPDLVYWFENFKNIEIFNVWGPTETAIVNAAHQISQNDIDKLKLGLIPPIGKSTQQMTIKIAVKDQESVNFIEEQETLGELVVLGDSVGPGYIQAIDFQSKFFVIDGVRGYRTGDLGFYKDNLIYITGRNANYIKYQGFRIDPLEVEMSISMIPNVILSCLVLVSKKVGEELVILIQLKNDSTISIAEVKNEMRSKLPNYMIPKKVYFIKQLPLNSNGKLDRNECLELAQSLYDS